MQMLATEITLDNVNYANKENVCKYHSLLYKCIINKNK